MTLSLLLGYVALAGWFCAFVCYVEMRDAKRGERSSREALATVNGAWRAVVDDIVTNRSRVALRTDDLHVLVVTLPVQHEIDYTQETRH